MSRALALIRSSHPEPGGAVTVAMTLLAIGAGHRGWAVLGGFLAGGGAQPWVGGVTDGLAADRARTAGRGEKPVAEGAVSRRTVGTAGLLASLAIPLLGL